MITKKQQEQTPQFGCLLHLLFLFKKSIRVQNISYKLHEMLTNLQQFFTLNMPYNLYNRNCYCICECVNKTISFFLSPNNVKMLQCVL